MSQSGLGTGITTIHSSHTGSNQAFSVSYPGHVLSQEPRTDVLCGMRSRSFQNRDWHIYEFQDDFMIFKENELEPAMLIKNGLDHET